MHKLAKSLMDVLREPQKIFYHYTHQVLLLYYSCNDFNDNDKNSRKMECKGGFSPDHILDMLAKVLEEKNCKCSNGLIQREKENNLPLFPPDFAPLLPLQSISTI